MIPFFHPHFELKRYQTILTIAWSTLLFSLDTVNHAESPPTRITGSLPRTIETTIRGEVQRRHIPGIAAAVVQHGKLAQTWCIGLSDIENQIPVTKKTMFRFASVSKPITATMVMKQIERGQLSLEAKLSSIIPNIPAHLGEITIRQLLSHQAGLRHYQANALQQPLHHFTSTSDAFDYRSQAPLLSKPGERFGYSTFGYLVLAVALEHIEPTPFIDQLRNRVFLPAKMKTARADHLYELIPHRASGYFRSLNGDIRRSQPADLSAKIPGGGLMGTIGDLSSFLAAIQNGDLLSQRSLQEMWTEQKLNNGSNSGYGLGWHLGLHENQREVYHSGSQPKTSSLLYLRPEMEVGIAILCNLEQIHFLPLARAIAKLARP